MGYYISKDDQRRMLELSENYITANEELDTMSTDDPMYRRKKQRAEMGMNEFYVYADKIIEGIIRLYRYYQFGEMDDLMNEGRTAIYLSMMKRQWKPDGASLFSFLSTVVQRNLLSYTLKMNRNNKYRSDQEIETLYNNRNLIYEQDMEKNFIVEDVFNELQKYFEGRDRFVELSKLLRVYYGNNLGKKFVKKKFIEFVKGYTFSPSLVNTFFSHIKRIQSVRDILFKE